jgi:hypothetical protein
MDYLSIVLKGYSSHNEREYLSKYFYREFKKAEENHYESDEFFSGCLKAVDMLEQNLKDQINDRKRELYENISLATNRKITFPDPKGMTYDELCKEIILYCETELKGININDYFIDQRSLAKYNFPGHLFGSEVLYIKTAILEARKNALPQLLDDSRIIKSKNEKPKQDHLRRPVAFCVCLHYLSGKFKISGMTKEGLKEYIRENFKDKKTEVPIASVQKVANTLCGYLQDKEKEKAPFYYDSRKKEWQFKEDNFTYMKEAFPEDFLKAEKLLKELV